MSRRNRVALFNGGGRLSKPDHRAFSMCNDRATDYKRQGLLCEALNELKAALLIKPNDIYTLNNCGDILNKMTDFEGALARFNHVLHLDPKNKFAQKGQQIAQKHCRKYAPQDVKSSSQVRFFGGESNVKARQTANGKYTITEQFMNLHI